MKVMSSFYLYGSIILLSLMCFMACVDDNNIVIMDFEGDDYGDWEVRGEAFGSGPAHGGSENQKGFGGFKGRGLVNSFLGGDKPQGTLTSLEFKIQQPYINFKIGGGNHAGETCMNLVIDGEIVRTVVGRNNEYLSWSHWDVSGLESKNARIEIVDKRSIQDGHISVDHIVQSSRAFVLPNLERKITVNHAYIHIPVKTYAEKRRMKVIVDGDLLDDFDIELAEGEPDFWVFIDLSPYIGKQASIQVTQPWESDPTVLDRITQCDTIKNADTLYHEKYRPQFHFTSRRGWNNDPNGLVYYNGKYHLFYQHNPYGRKWGNMHWGHTVSTDLVHWKEQGDAISPDELGTIYSGSAVVDWNNTSGFKTGDEKTIVCFYTSAGSHDAMKEVPYTQSIAFSNDSGRTFTKFVGNPVIDHIIDRNRDPKVIWHELSKQWVKALYLTKNDYALLASPNLKDWTRIYTIQIPGCGECPDIFELPVDGNQRKKKWVFWGANSSYIIGSFDGKTFMQESEVFKSYAGGTAYAAQTFSDIPQEDGRRIQISWLRCTMPEMPFNQMMSFPVELTLRMTEEGIRLFSEPVREIEKIHARKYTWKPQQLEPSENPLSSVSGDLFDIRADITVGTATECGLKIRGIPVVYNNDEQSLSCQNHSASLKPVDGRIRLRILLDRTSIEIFANDGSVYMPIGVIPPDGNKSLELYTKGAPVHVNTLEVYELKSIWSLEQPLLKINFLGLQHIGLPVSDIERSREFYQNLGFENVMEKVFDNGTGTIRVAMMKRERVVIELYQLPPDQLAEIRSRKDGHIDHIAFDVADIDSAFDELKRAGLKPLQNAPVKLDFWERGCKYFSIRGPDGEILEFNQIL